MRWQADKPPTEGDTRIRIKFLFIPKCINGEWRWLETATWDEEYVRYWFPDEGAWCAWTAREWIET